WPRAPAPHSPPPAAAPRELRRQLEADADAAVVTAVAWLAARPGGGRTVSHSSLVQPVLARTARRAPPLPGRPGARPSGRRRGHGAPRAGTGGGGRGGGAGRSGRDRAGRAAERDRHAGAPPAGATPGGP